MANLRDRGYGNSMEGLQLKKVPERHTRKKTVAPGEADVSKGRKVSNTPVQDGAVVRLPSPDEIRATPPYVSVPEYGPVGLPSSDLPYSSNTPISLHYSDPLDQLDHQIDVEIPARTQRVVQSMKDKYSNTSGMSLDEIKKRMRELEAALSYNYNMQNVDYKKAVNRPSYFTNADEEMQDMAQDELLTSAIRRDEAAIDQLFFEYNNLKNEYNVRLARYLQGLR